MKEIPELYVKVNQTGIVLFVIIASLFQIPYLLFFLFAIQVVGVLTGYNLFVLIAKPFLTVEGKPSQAIELQRFNNLLAVSFLVLSMIGFFLLNNSWLGYGFAWMLGIAAFVAICGYCVGCTMYFQFNQLKARWRRV